MFTPPTIHTDKQCLHNQLYTQTNNVYTTSHKHRQTMSTLPAIHTEFFFYNNSHEHMQTMFKPPAINTHKQCLHHQPYTQTNNVYITNHTHRQTMFTPPTIHTDKQCLQHQS